MCFLALAAFASFAGNSSVAAWPILAFALDDYAATTSRGDFVEQVK